MKKILQLTIILSIANYLDNLVYYSQNGNWLFNGVDTLPLMPLVIYGLVITLNDIKSL